MDRERSAVHEIQAVYVGAIFDWWKHRSSKSPKGRTWELKEVALGPEAREEVERILKTLCCDAMFQGARVAIEVGAFSTDDCIDELNSAWVKFWREKI